MGFKNFRIHVVIRVLLIVASSFLFAYLIRYTEYSISAVILGFIIVYQVYALVSFVETTNRKLTGFLQSIKHADFSSSFTDHGLGKSFDELNNAFNEVIQEFRKYRSEREEHLNYLFTVIQHVSIGIIAFKDDGIIDQYNQAVLKLFKIKNIRHLNDLAVVKADLPARLHHLKAGDKTLVKLFIDDEILQIAVNATQFRMRGQDFTLISLQNIHNELEEKEIESWQKLIRVLTHEIMNSITPISSLAGTVKDILIAEENDGSYRLGSLDDEQVETVHSALSTISKRTQGLLNFVEIYRNLTRIPKPNFRYFKVADLFVNAELLIRPKTEMFQIECECIVKPENLMITADPDLIDQVIINLLLNAMDAVQTSEHPKISLIASEINGRIKIEVRDNGTGIKPDIMDKIFMPFFTSKKHGSGIGLSLSRQIMHLHKGTISVKSKPDEGSVFTLLF
ncbi:MAG: GHKL domain-containing protein [Sphingobacteriia bacterium]|nr:GHKL domain-containing protein [Sphingobacteriia bacterium]